MERIISKKISVLFSYILIICNTISSIVLVPFYLKFLGVEGYGFYQMIYSVASYILILDFGIGTTMVRYITEYRVKEDKYGEENLSAHVLIIAIFLSIIIFLIGAVLSQYLGDIYKTLTVEKVSLGKRMFNLMIIVLILTVFEHYLEGIAMAYDLYAITKILGIIKILFKCILVLLMLYSGIGVVSLFYVDFIAQTLIVVLYGILVFAYIKFTIRLHSIDKSIFLSVGSFMFAIMLQSIVAYVNNTADKTILGIMLGEQASGIYGLSMTFITMFNMIPTSILTLFLPKATKMIVSGSSMSEQTDIAAHIGRYQMIVCGGIISAFIVVGRDFIALWAKSYVDEIWMITLIIMIPNAVPLIQNYCLNILDALKKRLFRSIVLLGLSILNVILTVFLIKRIGLLGAPIGTGVAYIIGHWIVINIYYDKIIGIDILHMWQKIIHRLLLVIVLSTVAVLPINFFKIPTSWSLLVIKSSIWAIVYTISIYCFGLEHEERNLINRTIRRFVNK